MTSAEQAFEDLNHLRTVAKSKLRGPSISFNDQIDTLLQDMDSAFTSNESLNNIREMTVTVQKSMDDVHKDLLELDKVLKNYINANSNIKVSGASIFSYVPRLKNQSIHLANDGTNFALRRLNFLNKFPPLKNFQFPTNVNLKDFLAPEIIPSIKDEDLVLEEKRREAKKQLIFSGIKALLSGTTATLKFGAFLATTTPISTALLSWAIFSTAVQIIPETFRYVSNKRLAKSVVNKLLAKSAVSVTASSFSAIRCAIISKKKFVISSISFGYFVYATFKAYKDYKLVCDTIEYKNSHR